MNDIFRPYLRGFVVIYLDDVSIYLKTLADHQRHVRLVLDVLRKEKFFACKAKYDFRKTEIKFLGHIVSAEGIKVNPAKMAAVADWPPLKNPHEVRSFLGLVNYFCKFIQGYAKLASPLTDSTKKNKEWQWTNAECQDAFEGVKWALTNAPVLKSSKVEEPFVVVSDASLTGVGAVLLQDNQLVAFESRKFSPAERNYTTSEQELLAMVHALRVWRCYLEGNSFQLITDHCPNTYLQTQQILSRRQARWMEFLRRFNIDWQYRAGRTNVADPLSRFPVGPALAAITRSSRNDRQDADREGLPDASIPASVLGSPTGKVSPIDLAKPLKAQILEAYAQDSWLRDAINRGSPSLSVTVEGFY
jgi:hypothetical protein